MPMLLDIRDTVADYAELIARVVGVDVEVVDAGLNRLAGTGLYASGVGENIRAEGETYRHVMRIRRSFVMETPREHFICTRCPGRDLCRETLSISTPIIDGSDVLGVIGARLLHRRGPRPCPRAQGRVRPVHRAAARNSSCTSSTTTPTCSAPGHSSTSCCGFSKSTAGASSSSTPRAAFPI